MTARRPRLALPFTILTAPGVVRLIAGEDFRYTLTLPNLDEWLPALLSRCDGRLTVEELVAELPTARRQQAMSLLERLYGERILVDGSAADAHQPAKYRIVMEGQERLVLRLPLLSQLTAEIMGIDVAKLEPIHILCQDRLDWDEAIRFNRRRRSETAPWLWVSTGAMTRGYVSPVFLPNGGPCLHCLLRTFRTLSPAPELHDALLEHVQRGQPVTPVSFPEEARSILSNLVEWKVKLLQQPNPPAALYRLHVVEVDSLEVTTHRVFRDPECPDCGRT